MKIKPSRLELEVLEALWKVQRGSIREILEAMPEEGRPEYTTVQTLVYRLEAKGGLRRVKKIGNAHIFEPLVTRESTLGSLIEDFIGLIGGSHGPVVAHLVDSGRISSAELKELEKLIQQRRK